MTTPYPQQPPAYQPCGATTPMPSPKKKPTRVWVVSGIGVLLVIGLIGSACGGSKTTTATSTTTAATTSALAPLAAPSAADSAFTASQMPAAPAAPAAPAQLTIPEDLVGKNGAIAEAELKKLGFKNIEHASGTPGVQMVIMLSNWTVSEVEPGPGTVTDADTPIVLTLVKKNR